MKQNVEGKQYGNVNALNGVQVDYFEEDEVNDYDEERRYSLDFSHVKGAVRKSSSKRQPKMNHVIRSPKQSTSNYHSKNIAVDKMKDRSGFDENVFPVLPINALNKHYL